MQLASIGAPETIYQITKYQQLQQMLKIPEFQNKQLHLQLQYDDNIEQQLFSTKQLLKDYKCFIRLNLSRKNIDSSHCGAVYDLLQQSNLLIYSLDLSFNRLSDQQVGIILQSPHFTKLAALDLSFTNITGETIQTIISQTAKFKNQPRFCKLNLSGTKIADGCAHDLLHLISSDRSLVSFSVAATDLKLCSIELISKQLDKQQTIEELDFSATRMHNSEAAFSDQALALGGALRTIFQIRSLRRVNLSGVPMGDIGFQYTIEAIEGKQNNIKFSRLEEMQLNSCQLTDQALHLLGSLLGLDSNISFIGLRGNQFTDQGLYKLEQCFKRISLQRQLRIDMRHNLFSDQTSFDLENQYPFLALFPNSGRSILMLDMAGHYSKYLKLPIVQQHDSGQTIQELQQAIANDQSHSLGQQQLHSVQWHGDDLDYEPLLGVINHTVPASNYNGSLLAQTFTENLVPKKDVNMQYSGQVNNMLQQFAERLAQDPQKVHNELNINDTRSLLNPDDILHGDGNRNNIQQLINRTRYVYTRSKKLSLDDLLQNWEMIDDSSNKEDQQQANSLILSQNNVPSVQQMQDPKPENDSRTDTSLDHQQHANIKKQYEQASQVTGGTRISVDELSDYEKDNVKEQNTTKMVDSSTYDSLSYEVNESAKHGESGHTISSMAASSRKIIKDSSMNASINRSYISNNYMRLNSIHMGAFPQRKNMIQYYRLLENKEEILNTINGYSDVRYKRFVQKLNDYFDNCLQKPHTLSFLPDENLFLNMNDIDEQRVDEIHDALMKSMSCRIQLENFDIFRKLRISFDVQADIQIHESNIQPSREWVLLVVQQYIVMANKQARQAIKIEPTCDFLLTNLTQDVVYFAIHDWGAGYRYDIMMDPSDFKLFREVITVWGYEMAMEERSKTATEKENVLRQFFEP